MKVSLKTKAFVNFIGELTKNDYLAVEASTNTFWFVGIVKERVKECHVINPYKFSIISNAIKKTDRVDALKIAMRLKYYICFDKSEDELPTVYIPPVNSEETKAALPLYIIKTQGWPQLLRRPSVHRTLHREGSETTQGYGLDKSFVVIVVFKDRENTVV